MAAFTPGKSTLLWQLVFEGEWPMAVAFVGNRRLVAANQKGEAYVWNLPDAPDPEAVAALKDKKPSGDRGRSAPDLRPARRLEGHANGVTRLVALPDGRHVVSASLDRTLRLWDLDSSPAGTVEVVLDSESRKAESRRTGKKDGLDAPGIMVETQAAVHTFEGHKDWIHALNLSADGRRLISGDTRAVSIVWDVAERAEIARWTGRPWNWIAAAALSPDGEAAFVSEHRYKRDDFDVPAAALKLWDVAEKKETLDILKVQFPKLNPDDASYGGSQVWRKFVAAGLITVAWSPDGKVLAAGQGGETDKGQVHLLDAQTGKLLRDVSGHQYGVTDAFFTADSKYVISAGRDTSVRICQVEDGKEVLALGSPRGGQFKDWLSAVALSPDQKWIAAADIGGLVHVWQVEPA